MVKSVKQDFRFEYIPDDLATAFGREHPIQSGSILLASLSVRPSLEIDGLPDTVARWW